jgi:O-antigen ligase
MAAVTVIPGSPASGDGAVRRLAYGAVWVTFAVSGVVFAEPAPVDVLMLGLVVLLPLVRLVRITPGLLVFACLHVVCAVAATVAVVVAEQTGVALMHTAVTYFLAAMAIVLAAFLMAWPERHARLIFSAWIVAAVIAGGLGLLGYFQLVPGAFDLFTRLGRVSGTFKDPNVLAPFLVPPVLYLLQHALMRGAAAAVWVLPAAVLLGLSVLLSFSRGAWFVLAASLAVYAYLAFVTAQDDRARLTILSAIFAAVMVGFVATVAVMQSPAILEQVLARAALNQSYDQGPEGRFGGQIKAWRLIIDNPLGIGAQNFAPRHHMEEPHNVYLAMFLNAGWIGGFGFLLLVLTTAVYGLRHAFRRTISQPVYLVVYACFLAHALEGFVIDLDHWRHFHVLIAMVWGLMLGDRAWRRRQEMILRRPTLTPRMPVAALPVAALPMLPRARLPLPIAMRRRATAAARQPRGVADRSLRA